MDVGALVTAWKAISKAGVITAPTHGICSSRDDQAENP